MTELPEEEVSETFVLVERPHRIDLSDLPVSPRKAYKAAAEMGWEVRAWLSAGEFPPTFYVGSSETHNAGDIKTDRYLTQMFTVEARDLDMPLGFRAYYLGKEYANGRKAVGGAFGSALVADPVGVPRELRAVYEPIKQLRGEHETETSIKRRLAGAQKMADQMNDAYNDGTIVFQNTLMFTVARDFDSWLAEWRSFISPIPTAKKATLNA